MDEKNKELDILFHHSKKVKLNDLTASLKPEESDTDEEISPPEEKNEDNVIEREKINGIKQVCNINIKRFKGAVKQWYSIIKVLKLSDIVK